MKHAACGLFIYILATFSCTKPDGIPPNHLPGDDGCIAELTIPVTGQNIPAATVKLIDKLFLDNRIDNSKFRYFHYLHDSLNGADYKIVKVEQYVNNLRIFTGQLAYEFKNDVLNFRDGLPATVTSLNTAPHLTLAQVRKLFIDDAGLFEQKAQQYNDTCLKAEFGYFNLNAGTRNAQEMLVTSWRVTFKNQTYPVEYPQACYQDNGIRIYYDNGITIYK